MNKIQDRNIISNEIQRVNRLININLASSFVEQNIFNERFKFVIFTEFFDMRNPDGFKKLFNFAKCINENFYIKSLEKANRDFLLEIEIGKDEETVNNDDSLLKSLYQEVVSNIHEAVYYPFSEKWFAWFKINWELGVFVFETEEHAQLFVDIVGRELVYSVEEVMSDIWVNPLLEVEKRFKSNYSKISYIK